MSSLARVSTAFLFLTEEVGLKCGDFTRASFDLAASRTVIFLLTLLIVVMVLLVSFCFSHMVS